ncbi:unnamed protein product [Lactuca virosa]|uniref:Uncharacterized protein n=1 Tax=Lactuca virosa TaxID=75947 RepID=A0AAU9PL86_9ASTR|nr:unnamed protein product [Lactuca virosa]
MVSKPKFQFAFEEIEVSDDEEDQEDQGNELSENEFENFIQQSISFPEEDASVTPPSVTEREELQRTTRKPPQTVPVDTETPSGSDLEDFAHALLPRKCKRRDPRPGVLITDSILTKSTPIEPNSMAQNIPSPFIESTLVTQEMSSPFTECIPMDQDFESPIVEEDVIPSEGAQASGSSFETPELDLSKGKNKLLDSELVDVVLLQNRVFDLEQSSVKKDLIIGKQDIRIRDLERENSDKTSKILELQENLGGLIALFFDLKQRLFQTFGDEFHPLSADGEKIIASSSDPANPASPSSSERATRPTPNAYLDTFLSSGLASAQERREKQVRVEQLKGKMLVMKHSYQNAPGDNPEMFFRETGKKFIDKYGDRSGIIMWGYDADKRMWVVKRKSGRIEYYEKKVDFLS